MGIILIVKIPPYHGFILNNLKRIVKFINIPCEVFLNQISSLIVVILSVVIGSGIIKIPN